MGRMWIASSTADKGMARENAKDFWTKGTMWQHIWCFKKCMSKSAHTALAVKACLLGCNLAILNAQVTFVYIAVAISALAGGGGGHLKFSHRNPSSAGVFVIYRTIFGRWIWRGYWDGNLGRFGGVPATEKRTWEASGNGKTDNNEKQTANTDVFKFGMLEYWTHCKKTVLWTNFILKNA